MLPEDDTDEDQGGNKTDGEEQLDKLEVPDGENTHRTERRDTIDSHKARIDAMLEQANE